MFISLSNLEQIKDQLNQSVLNFLPMNWHEMALKILPQHWQEWTLLLMGLPFILLFAVEWSYLKSQGRADDFSLKRAITNFSLGASYISFEVVIQALVVLPICYWMYQFRLFTIEVNWLTALPIFVAMEFCYYWFHWCSHRITWFWSAHVVHHSDDRMNLSTAMRQSLLYSVVGWWLFFTPLMLLGVDPVWVFFFYALDLIYQYFIHTEAIGKLPAWVEFIFDTPSNHRAHHGTNPEYIDKNYGGVLIIFDRLFGTYVEEDPIDNPVQYGAVGEKSTDNIFQINFDTFIRMWRKVMSTKGIKNKIRVLAVPPEEFSEKFVPENE